MTTQIQRRRGTTAQHSTFTGAVGEVTVDTDKDTVVVHDGATVGGHPLQKQFPALGSAAAPTYTFTGDTNTGIYSPGADQVGISTNGTGRLFINSAGHVGIGKSPAQLLDGESAGNAQFRVTTTDTSGSNVAQLVSRYTGGGGGTASTAIIRSGDGYVIYGASTSSPVVFITNETERLRIDSSGRLLVGTSSQSGGALLQVNGDRIRVATAKTPASATDTGTAGEICWDASYVYVCTATNTWKRSALSTW